jgi:hypothetical protein
MNSSPIYDVDNHIVYHFYQHAVYGLRSTINRHGVEEKNRVEQLGDLGLWPIEIACVIFAIL